MEFVSSHEYRSSEAAALAAGQVNGKAPATSNGGSAVPLDVPRFKDYWRFYTAPFDSAASYAFLQQLWGHDN